METVQLCRDRVGAASGPAELKKALKLYTLAIETRAVERQSTSLDGDATSIANGK
jgi:hypothetical protein